MGSISSCNSSRQPKRSIWIISRWVEKFPLPASQMPAWFKRPVSFCPSPSALFRRQNAALINITFWTFSRKPITALGEISPSLKGLKRCQLPAENNAKRFCVGLITVTSGRLHLLDAQRTPGQDKGELLLVPRQAREKCHHASVVRWTLLLPSAESFARFHFGISVWFSYTQCWVHSYQQQSFHHQLVWCLAWPPLTDPWGLPQ